MQTLFILEQGRSVGCRIHAGGGGGGLWDNFTARKRSYEKVIFLSYVNVCSHEDGSHVTITHDALYFTIQGPP